MKTRSRRTLATISTAALLSACLPGADAQGWAQGLAAGETSAPTLEEKSGRGMGSGVFFSNDSEGFTTRRLTLEYLPQYRDAQFLSGLRYTAHHFAQDAWSRAGQQISFLQRRIDPVSANGWQWEGGIFHQGQHDLLTLDANYRTLLGEHTNLELFLNRDWVETALALDRGMHFNFGGLALDQAFSPKLTLTGLLGIQHFSDGNVRNHARIRLSLQPDLDLGLTLQARFRTYSSSHDKVAGAYFNPERYQESMLAVGWRNKFDGWLNELTAGIGRQKVATDSATATNLLEWRLQSPLITRANRAGQRNYSFRVRAGRSQSASLGGPDYRYRYVHGEWILAF